MGHMVVGSLDHDGSRVWNLRRQLKCIRIRIVVGISASIYYVLFLKRSGKLSFALFIQYEKGDLITTMASIE